MCMQNRRDFNERIVMFLQNAKGDKIDIAAVVYDMLCQEKNVGDALRFFLEKADDIESSESKEVTVCLTANEKQELNKNEGLVANMISKLIDERLEPDAFYNELWKKVIQADDFFKERKERIYALYRIWRDGRIPYYKLEEGLKMSNEKFHEIVREHRNEIEKAVFILNSDFSQKTERSSLLVRVLDSCKSEEERAVILAQILAVNERITGVGLLTQIVKKHNVKSV